MKIRGSLALKLGFCLVAAASAAAASTAPTLLASPSAVDFQYSAGESQPLPVEVTVTASVGSSPTVTFTLVPPTGIAATLFILSPVVGNTVSVEYDVTTLTALLSQPGTYTASITATAAGFANLSIPLTFVVGGAAPSIAAIPASLMFNAPSSAYQQPVQLSASGGISVSFSVTSDSSWLSATASPSYTPSNLTVTVNPLNLPGGTHLGNITITPLQGGALTIPVILQVGPVTLAVSPASLAFAYTVAGTTPPPQVLQLSSPLSNDTYTAQAHSVGNWLLVNGVTAQISGSLPASLNVTVSAASLAAGTYQGTITVFDAAGGIQTVTVTLVVSGISSVANPTSLTFVAQVGGPAPAEQMVVVNGFGAAASFTVTVNGAWLSVSSAGGPAPAQLTVSANPAGLAPGTYSGDVEINLDTHIEDIQVTFFVSASPVLTTDPGAFVLSYLGGSGPLSPVALNVNVSSLPQQSFTVAPGVPAWLQIGSAASSLETPASVIFTVTPQTLPTGTYLAEIILVPAAADGVPVVAPVLLTVSSAPAVVANPSSLSFSGTAGSGPQNTTVEITASSPTSFTASASTVSGGNWLSVSPTSGNANPTNTPLTITADATSLVQGTYHGTVTLTAGGGVVTQIPVTFTVSSAIGTISISPSTLAFTYAQNGALPAAQSVQITGSLSFTDSASTSGGGTWLAVTPASGTGNTTLTVSVNPAGLALGTYNGTITVTPTGRASQTVAVTLTVVAVATLVATPNTLTFAYTVPNLAPAAQTVSVTSAGQAVTFTAVAASSGWLSVTPTSGTTPATLSVSVNPANLGAGSYTGSITLSGGGGNLQLSIAVTVIVNAPLPVIGGVVNAASYLTGGISPGEIVTIFGFSLGPATGVLATIDSAGYIETTLANVKVTFNGYPAPILYASSGQINVIAPYELTGASNVSIEATFGSARSNALTLPVVSSAPGVFSDNATGLGEGAILDENYHLVSASNPVSGGSVIQIFATGQGQTSPGGVDGLIEPVTLPLPAPLLSAGATIGGVTANIQYAGAAPGLVAGALQINAFVPDGLPSGPASLVVSFGGVDYSQPGITVAIK